MQVPDERDLIGHRNPEEPAEVRDPELVLLVPRDDDHRGRVARPGPVDAEGVRAALLADHRDVVLAGAPRDRLRAEERRLDVEERGLVLARESRGAHLEPLPLKVFGRRVPRGRRRDLRA